TQRVDVVLLVFGGAAMAGIWITGKLVERHLRATVLASLAVFAATALVLGLAAHVPAVIYLAMAVWGLSFGGAATLLQTALADTAGSGADVALSMNVVAWNGAIAAAGVVGGALLETWGAGAFPWAMLGLLLPAFLVTWSARTHGFRPGRRSGGAPVAGH
ncbi:MAG: MFS transporter, partial [Janthinobacterium sp.]